MKRRVAFAYVADMSAILRLSDMPGGEDALKQAIGIALVTMAMVTVFSEVVALGPPG